MSVSTERLAAALARSAATAAFDGDQLSVLAARSGEETHSQGDVVLREGQRSERLFLLEEGRIEVRKSGDAPGESFVIVELGPGALFGDMSFLDGRPASATLTALTPARLLSVERAALTGGSPAERDTYEAVLRALATLNVERLRAQNESQVRALRAELESTKTKNQAAQFLTLIVIVFGIQNVAGVLLSDRVDVDHPSYEWGMLLTFLVPSLYFVRRFGWTAADIGITTRRWRRSLIEAAALAPLLVAGVIGAVAAMRSAGVLPADQPLLSGALVTERPWEIGAYVLHAGLQELGSRGIFQGSLQRFLGPERGVEAVLVISAMFGILHLHLGLPMVALSLVGSLFFGLLYLRHGTLIGVTFLHYVVGMVAELLDLM